jgi:hypothetical protein
MRRRQGLDLYPRDRAGERDPAQRLGRHLVVLIVVSLLAWPATASALPAGVTGVDAPGLESGPFITRAGLVWESQRGIVLTDRQGSSRVLAAPDARNWEGSVDLAWFGSDWWVLARRSGVFGGRIGGPLRRLPLLRRCTPASPSVKPGLLQVQYAVSGEDLYVALPKACLSVRGASQAEVLDIDLRSRRSRVLARVPGLLDGMAASGRYLAIAYSQNVSLLRAERPPHVRVIDATTGAVVNRVTPPPSTPARPEANGVSDIQVDAYGDVLVAATCCSVAPGQLAHSAQPPLQRTVWWWSKAGSKVGHEVHLGDDAVLSDGRVAFFSSSAGSADDETIDLTDLRSGATRTLVTLAGTLNASGGLLGRGALRLALSGDSLTWSQQSTVLEVTSTRYSETCRSVPLSPVELVSIDLRRMPSSSIVVNGAPIPSQYANEPACIEV